MSNPAIIAISGFAAAGKTTLANSLAAYYAFPLFSSDTIAEAIRLSKASRDTSYDYRWAAYDVLFALCRAQLANGLAIIIDSPMNYPSLWQQLRQICEESRAKLLPIVLECPFEVSAERAKLLRAQEPEYGLGRDEVEEYRSTLDLLGSLDFPHHKIDASQDSDSILSTAVTIIDTALDRWEPMPCGIAEEEDEGRP